MRLLALALAALAAADKRPHGLVKRKNVDVITQNLMVDFEGNSGGFKVFPIRSNSSLNGFDAQRFFSLRYKSLDELDSTGKKLPGSFGRSFKLNNLDLSTGMKEVCNTTCTNVTVIVADVDMGQLGQLHIEHLINIVNTTIPINATVTGTAGGDAMVTTMQRAELKFAYSVTGWPFLTSTDSLQLTFMLNLGDNDTFAGKNGPAQRPGPRKDKQVVMPLLGAGESQRVVLSFEPSCFTDPTNSSDPMSGTMRPVALSNDGNEWSIGFPSFKSSMWYDPTLSTEPVDGHSDGAASTGIALAALAAAFLSMLVLSTPF